MLLFVDTETNGLPKNAPDDREKWPRVVQLAWAVYDTGGNRESVQSHIIYPTDFTIPHDTAKFHTITTERAKKEGISLHKVLPLFNADAERSDTVIAHNLAFDLPVIRTEFLRCTIPTRLADKQKFCTMMAPRIISFCKLPAKSGRGYKWPALNELYLQLFEEELTGSHNAGADVEACARCYFELKKRGIIE